MARSASLGQVSLDAFFVEQVAARFPEDLLGKLALVSKAYLAECRRRSDALPVKVAALKTPDEARWALESLEAMRMADAPPGYDKRSFINSLAAGGSIPALESAAEMGCVWDEEAGVLAAGNGRLDALKWMHEKGAPLVDFRCLNEAACGGHLDVIEWFVTIDEFGDVETLMEMLPCEAACGNHVHVLDWLEAVWPDALDRTDPEVAMYAAFRGSLGALEWLRRRRFDMSEVCDGAANGGHMDVLRWARAKRYPWTADTCAGIAKHGDLATLRWAAEQGCPMSGRVLVEAVLGGHVHVAEWAAENGCEMLASACAAAATRGSMETLRWLRGRGCAWDHNTCSEAARRGDLAMLAWARQNGCPWHSCTCTAAARAGHLEALKWARENGCPWGPDTFRAAEERGDLKLMRWARANGCPQ